VSVFIDSGDDAVIISRVEVVDSILSASAATVTTLEMIETMSARNCSASSFAPFSDSSAETTT